MSKTKLLQTLQDVRETVDGSCAFDPVHADALDEAIATLKLLPTAQTISAAALAVAVLALLRR